MKDIKICVIGGDRRQGYLANQLSHEGCSVSAYGVTGYDNLDSLELALEGANVVILPLPVSPDGVFLSSSSDEGRLRISHLLDTFTRFGVSKIIGGSFKKELLYEIENRKIEVLDFAKSEALLVKNALCTAEGAIEIAMRELPINIQGSHSAVIGYGRIARLLTRRLIALGGEVSVFARRAEALACAVCDGASAYSITEIKESLAGTDVIFNTVPAMILDKSELSILDKDTLIIDLASAPGGVNFSEVKLLGLKAIWALSLPGKYAPKTAAKIICAEIRDKLTAGGDST